MTEPFSIENDFAEAELGDERRVARLVELAAVAQTKPDASFPKMTGSNAGLEALYRFLNNGHFGFERILEAHTVAAGERAVDAGETIVVHDTTSFQFAHADPREIGFLQTGKPGFFAHFSLFLAADGSRRPFGVGHVQTNHRSSRAPRGGRKINRPGSETSKLKDRESLRWWEGVRMARERLSPTTRATHVMDRESDSYELLAQMQGASEPFVVRVRVDRVARAADNATPEWSKLQALIAPLEGIFEREVPLSPRRGRSAPNHRRLLPARKHRAAQLSFSATQVILRKPPYLSKNLPAELPINVVRVFEPQPPAGEKAVEWLLFTSKAVETAADIEHIVDIYRQRWVIEEYFKALKTGCIYEKRELESREALLKSLALFAPVACRLLWLRSRAREKPDSPASEVLDADEIDALRKLARRPLPDHPTAHDVLMAIAQIGGHLKRNGQPGWLTLRRGLDDLEMFTAGWRAARAEM